MVVALIGAIAPCTVHANPPDPLVPLLRQMEGHLRRNETDGVTLDPRYALSPAEVTRLSIVAQLLGYADLHAAIPSPEYRRAAVSRADFLLTHYTRITTGSAFDGMLGYSLLQAYDLTGDSRYLQAVTPIVQRLKTLQGSQTTLNWGMMAAMCLARYHDLTGDVAALQKTRSILASLRAYRNRDGSFPHYCARSSDIHYTGWLAMELMIVSRYVNDSNIDPLLSDIHGFLRARVGPTGNSRYSDCGIACSSDADGDKICGGFDRCPGTPLGCAVDSTGCEIDEDGDGTCDQGCLRDADLDRVCDRYDLCPETPQGCLADRRGCETDQDGDGNCDVAGTLPCHRFWSFGSGCTIDYESRGWVNELGYSAMVLDRFQDPTYHDVMGFLHRLTSHGAVPDKWGYFPASTDAIYPWAIEPRSVIRTSVVFWSLAAIQVSRVPRLMSRRPAQEPRRPFEASATGSGFVLGPPVSEGLMAVDRLVMEDAAAHLASDPPSAPGPGPRSTEPGQNTNPESPGMAIASVASPGRPGSNLASLRYELSIGADVSFAIFDVSGRRILQRSLGSQSRGTHELRWDCRDGGGRRVAPGLYWVQVRAGSRPALTARWFVPR